MSARCQRDLRASELRSFQKYRECLSISRDRDRDRGLVPRTFGSVSSYSRGTIRSEAGKEYGLGPRVRCRRDCLIPLRLINDSLLQNNAKYAPTRIKCYLYYKMNLRIQQVCFFLSVPNTWEPAWAVGSQQGWVALLGQAGFGSASLFEPVLESMGADRRGRSTELGQAGLLTVIPEEISPDPLVYPKCKFCLIGLNYCFLRLSWRN
jgi:hypothetical protein